MTLLLASSIIFLSVAQATWATDIGGDTTDHYGSYSWLWWTNGTTREGKRHLPDAPLDTFGAFGHGGIRAMVVMPKLDLRETSLKLENGWYTYKGNVVWGNAQHNDWWGGLRKEESRINLYKVKVRANITRNALGKVGPSLTEDLDKLTDAMIKYGYPGFEHCYGLWFDRRRDAHDIVQRKDANLVPPLLEQPWARSEVGTAWDGLPKYDLTKYNPWYFQRLRDFAALCDNKGAILLHNFYMQHALLERFAHYADFPWRPANCIQDTGMPDNVPAANAFYDLSNPVRRELHRLYIRKCLDELRDYGNVVHLTSEEYTGPLPFVQFWIDTILEWEKETGKRVHIGLGAPKDVLDAILSDPVRGKRVETIDLRYWWYKPDGSLNAPKGGKEVAGRYVGGSAETTPQQLYRQVKEYRIKYPDKAIIHQVDLYLKGIEDADPAKRSAPEVLSGIDLSRQQTWAFLMGGGSMLIRGMDYPDSPGTAPWEPPSEYIAPAASVIIQPTYDFIRSKLSAALLKMKPLDGAASDPDRNWCLAEPGRMYLVYALEGGKVRLDLTAAKGAFSAKWFNPRTGALTDANGGTVKGGLVVEFAAPDSQDWAFWLSKVKG